MRFGPATSTKTLETHVTPALESLLERNLVLSSAHFRSFDTSGTPDATWHLRFAADSGHLVKVRLEPFGGKIIEAEVCGAPC